MGRVQGGAPSTGERAGGPLALLVSPPWADCGAALVPAAAGFSLAGMPYLDLPATLRALACVEQLSVRTTDRAGGIAKHPKGLSLGD